MKKTVYRKSALLFLCLLALSLCLIACQPAKDEKSGDSKSQGDTSAKSDTNAKSDSGEKSDPSQTQKEEKKDEKQTARTPKINSQGDIRADETKDWVYALDTSDLVTYEAQNTKVTYEIHIPQINIDSDDAVFFNQQLENYAKQIRDVYHLTKGSASSTGNIVRYSVSKKDDLLSICIINTLPVRKVNKPDEFVEVNQGVSTINIDMKTGKIVDDQALLEKFQMQDIDERITDFFFKKYAVDRYKQENLPTLAEKIMFNDSNSNARVRSIINHLRNHHDLPEHPLYINFKEEFDVTHQPKMLLRNRKDKLHLFYNEKEDSLCVMLPDYKNTLEEAEEFIEIVLNQTTPWEGKLNPAYEYYSKKLGIDPSDENSPMAFSAYIGNIEMANQDPKVQGFLNDTKSSFLEMDYIEVGHFMLSPIKGQEMFLIIPKYDDTLVDIMQLGEQNGQSVYEHIDYGSNRNFLILCNHPDLSKDVEMYFHRKNRMSQAYTPKIDTKDNSNIVSAELMDISSLITKADSVSEEVQEHFDLVRFGLQF